MIFLKNNKSLFAAIVFFLFLLAFLIIRLVYAVNASQKSSEFFNEFYETDKNLPNWKEGEVRNLAKQIYWLEQKLELAKSDSISLAINLSDSLVQIHLKGLDLFHSKILYQHPENFLNSVNLTVYRQLTKVSEIKSEVANVPKKPIKKVKAPNNGNPQPEIKVDSISNPELMWYFTTENNLKVIITGVKMNSDSAFYVNPLQDLLLYKTHVFLSEIIPSEYSPTLYLWLNDTDAKVIHRAVPEKGKVLFRN